jgi:hypothetical protein
VLRGTGEPAPGAGVVGDVYVDTQTWFLYVKRSNEKTNPWGNYLFAVAATYQNTLKWFSSSPPTNDLGADGDYCLMWGGYPNYGIQPSILGPKAAGAWPANPAAVAVAPNPLYTADNEHTV